MVKYIDLLIGFVIFIYCIIINMISSNKIAFSTELTGFAIVLIVFHFVKNKIDINLSILKPLKLCIVILITVFIILEICIIVYPKDNKEDADYLIVLGAGLNGSNLSHTLKDRLDATLTCVNEYNNNGYIVVSGGQGENEDISEAEAMERYLLQKGIAKDKIIKEDKSVNTYENLKFSRDKIEDHSGKSIKDSTIKIITTDFHSFRGRILAMKNSYGKVSSYSSDTLSYLIPIFYLREAFALIKTMIFY